MPRLDSNVSPFSSRPCRLWGAAETNASGGEALAEDWSLDQAWVLKRINCLHTAPESALDDLRQRHRILNLRRRELVFKPDDPGDAVYLVETGRIRLSTFAASGREIVLGILEAGELFGEEPRAPGTLRSSSAVTLRDSRLWRLTRSDFEEVRADHPWMVEAMAEHLARRLLGSSAAALSVETEEAAPRLAATLLALAESRGDYDDEGRTWLRSPSSAVELAWLARLDRNTLLQTLRKFRSRGWVQFEPGALAVTDLPALRDQLEVSP